MVLYRAVTSLSASDGVVKSSIIAGCGYIMQPVICCGCNEIDFENDWSVDGVQGERQS